MHRTLTIFFSIIISINSIAQKPKVKHVVMIGLDGFGAYAVPKAEMPVLKLMMNQGSWTLKARCVLPSSSAVNWASLIMGAGPTFHGYTEWNSAVPEIPSIETNESGMFPSIFSILKEQKPKATTAVIYSWGGINPLVQKGTTDIRIDGKGNDEICVDSTVSVIINHKPTLTFVHLDGADEVGHNIGHDTPEYYTELKKIDAFIGRILSAVKDAGIADQTVIIVTADHGGINKGHGGKSLQEVQIPWIAYGKGIKADNEIKRPVINFDNAATIAWLLGLKTPDSWLGIPIKEVSAKK